MAQPRAALHKHPLELIQRGLKIGPTNPIVATACYQSGSELLRQALEAGVDTSLSTRCSGPLGRPRAGGIMTRAPT